MVPLADFSTVAGVSLNEVLSEDDIEDIINKMKKWWCSNCKIIRNRFRIVYAPAYSTILMIEAILLPRHFRPRFSVASLAWTPPRSTHARRLAAYPGQYSSGPNAGRARVVPRNPAGQYIPSKAANPHLRPIPAG